jgi:hypothetical protein
MVRRCSARSWCFHRCRVLVDVGGHVTRKGRLDGLKLLICGLLDDTCFSTIGLDVVRVRTSCLLPQPPVLFHERVDSSIGRTRSTRRAGKNAFLVVDLTILTTWPFTSASHLLLYQRNCRILLRLSFLGPYLTLPAICAGSLRTGLTSLRSHGEYQYFAADAMNRALSSCRGGMKVGGLKLQRWRDCTTWSRTYPKFRTCQGLLKTLLLALACLRCTGTADTTVENHEYQ